MITLVCVVLAHTTHGVGVASTLEPSFGSKECSDVRLADFNNDGLLDAVFACSDTFDKHMIAYNLGNYSFSTPTSLGGTCAVPINLEPFDADLDGDVDLALACFFSSTVIYYANVAGVLTGPTTIVPSLPSARMVVSGNIYPDAVGWPDLAVAGRGNTVAWYNNTGGGSFEVGAVLSNSVLGQSIRLFDVTNDGIPDALITTASTLVGGTNQVIFYPGLAVGGFGSNSQNFSLPAPFDAVASDYNGDGIVDIAVAALVENTNTLIMAYGTGGGAFGNPVPVYGLLLSSSATLEVADVNGDCLDDLVVGGSFGVVWVPYNGTSLQAPVLLAPGKDVAAIALGDLDQDGFLDLMLGSRAGGGGVFFSPLGNDENRFVLGLTAVEGVGGVRSIAVGDFDQDGWLDFAAAMQNENSVKWFKNEGTRDFPLEELVTSLGQASGICTCDFDGDTDLDLAFVGATADKLEWAANDGNSAFENAETIGPSMNGAFSVVCGDLNNDTFPDLAVAARDADAVYWFSNDGSGVFSPMPNLDTSFNSVAYLEMVDLDSDGNMDVVAFSATDDEIRWYEGQGLGVFQNGVVLASLSSADVLPAFGDVDGDGTVDAVTKTVGGNLTVLHNTLTLPAMEARSDVVFYVLPQKMVLAHIDADDHLDLVVASQASGMLWYANPEGTGVFEYRGSSQADNAVWVEVADMNGDGRLDILAAMFDSDLVAYFPQLGQPLVTGQYPATVQCALNDSSVSPEGDLSLLVACDPRLVSSQFGGRPIACAVPVGRPSSEEVCETASVFDASRFFIDLPLPGFYLWEVSVFSCDEEILLASTVVDRRVMGNQTGLVVPPNPAVGGPVVFEVTLRGMGGELLVAPAGYVFPPDVVSINVTVVGGGGGEHLGFDVVGSQLSFAPVLGDFEWYEVSVRIGGEEGKLDPVELDLRVDPSACSVVPNPGPSSELTLPSATPYVVEVTLRGFNGQPLNVVGGYDYSGVIDVDVSFASRVASAVLQLGADDATTTEGIEVVISSEIASSYLFSLNVEDVPVVTPFIVTFFLNCPPGTRVDQAICSPCEEGSYSSTFSNTSVACTACAAGLSSPEKSTSFLNCTCSPGEWFGPGVRTPNSGCILCPPGGLCVGELEYPVAEAGFFPLSQEDPYTFVACVRAGCERNGVCAPGYRQQFMCAQCAPGYYSASESECQQCPKGASGRLGGAALGLLVVAVGMSVFVAWSAARVADTAAGKEGGSSRQAAILAFRTRTTPVSVSLVLTAFQVVSILAQANFRWTDESEAILGVFSVFNIDAQAVAAECSLASFHTTYVLSVVTPFVLMGLVVVGVLVGKGVATRVSWLSGLQSVSVRTLVDSVVFTLAPLLYIPISKATLVLLDCSRLPNGDVVLDADNGVACLDSSWWAVFPVAFLSLALYVVGTPVYFGLTIWTHRNALFDPSVTSRFGSLYRNFRRDYYWGEIANLGKRLGIVVVALFFSKHQLGQIGFLLTILGASVIFVNSRRPYYVPMYNDIDVRLTVLVIAVLLLGTGSYAERSSESARTFFFVGAIGVVIALAVVSVHALVVDVLSLRKERKNEHYSAGQRQARMADYLTSELKDANADASLSLVAYEFLATLHTAKEESRVSPVGSEIFLGPASEIELDDL